MMHGFYAPLYHPRADGGDSFQAPSPTRGPWIQTYTGRLFYLSTPRPEDIDLTDIAASLAKQTRWSGHGLRFLSVAEHSVLVRREAALMGRTTIREQRTALLHDASEAYLLDISRPLKSILPEYKHLEAGLMAVIARRFDFAWPPEQWLHAADNAVAGREARDNMARGPLQKSWGHSPSRSLLQYWTIEQARDAFLTDALELGIR